jgi:catechol 2,3-dioxygenase-like lactoylglutathione lyase family enzyme
MAQLIHHMGMTVRNIDRSIQFYTSGFDLRLVLQNEMSGDEVAHAVGIAESGASHRTAFLAGENTVLELIEYTAGVGSSIDAKHNDPGACDCCFVVENIAAKYDLLRELGGSFWMPPAYIPEYGLKYAFARDPDLITLELLEFTGESKFGFTSLLGSA